MPSHLFEPFLRAPASAAVLTDFDGTLARIVDDPAAARPLPGTTGVLRRMAAQFARVEVVSGRPAAFLLEHLGGTGVRLTGLYGLEWVEGGAVVVHPDAEPWRAAVEDVARRFEASGLPAIRLERKGLSVTLHHREAGGSGDEAMAWAAAEAARTGLVVHPARMSFELRPPVDRDKGTVVRDATAGMAAACFAGDDRGDLPAFDALHRRRAAGVHTVRIAVRSPEAPPELLERADVVVDGPEGALALLARLAG